MRSLFIPVLAMFALPPAVPLVHASVCEKPAAAQARRPRWVFDHYLYDALLKQDWEVMVDCNHPEAPTRMKSTTNTSSKLAITRRAAGERRNPQPIRIQSGTAVEVLSNPKQPASIHLSGTATETAFLGQPIRVRLNASGNMVRTLVRGPHSVELVATAKPLWGEP